MLMALVGREIVFEGREVGRDVGSGFKGGGEVCVGIGVVGSVSGSVSGSMSGSVVGRRLDPLSGDEVFGKRGERRRRRDKAVEGGLADGVFAPLWIKPHVEELGQTPVRPGGPDRRADRRTLLGLGGVVDRRRRAVVVVERRRRKHV